MKSDMIQRTTSEGGASSLTGSSTKKWPFGSFRNRKFPGISGSSRDEKTRTSKLPGSPADADSHEPPANDTNPVHDSAEGSYRQLQALVARMRSVPAGPNHVDGAYKEFAKIRERGAALCHAILQEEETKTKLTTFRTLSNATETLPLTRRDASIEVPRSPGAVADHRSSSSTRSLVEVVTGSGGKAGGHGGDAWLAPVRDWKTCLETLTEAFKVSLAETYRNYERDATLDMVEALFSSKKFRKEAVLRMRNASVTKILSADPQFFPRYEIRFRNYERVKQELADIRRPLQAGESGIFPSRVIDEFTIAPRGDVVLEFANIGPDSTGSEPALRFRVSSAMLADTSPIFARMFSGHSISYYLHEAEDITDQLPPPPVQYFCEDGSEVKLYRMPQHETNRLNSLEILLHAAHRRNDKVPEDVDFEQFVAIAECSLRYKSTSPLERIVEDKWLPWWMHKGADDMPDGLLIISYAFGLRQLFTRASKSAVMNLVDEKDLQTKPWPQKIKDRIWGVRCAKMGQLYASCTSTVQEYIRPPARDLAVEAKPVSLSDLGSYLSSPVQPATTLTSTPRCPKGSHWCDASNLGWMILVYNELGLLRNIVHPDAASHVSKIQSPPRSLAQMMVTLSLVSSPPSPLHPGSLCDPTPAFRAAVADVYSSITGLTLFDISGKSHGWALSKHQMSEPQMLLTAGLNRMAAHEHVHSVVTEFPEEVRLQILGEMSSLNDLHAVAMINRAFYETYKRHELQLMRNILRADRIRYGSLSQVSIEGPHSPGESKVLKSESDMLKARGFGDGADAITLRSEDEEGNVADSDSDESDTDDTPHGSLRSSQRLDGGDDYDMVARDPPPPFQPRESNPPPPLPPIKLDRHNSSSDRSRSPDGSDASPTTPRQAPFDPRSQTSPNANQAGLVPTEDIDEPPMTDEEARRILWPDYLDASAPSQVTMLPPAVEGLREKFRLGDVSFLEGVEDKRLAGVEEKQLRSDHERLVGTLKDGRRGSSDRKNPVMRDVQDSVRDSIHDKVDEKG